MQTPPPSQAPAAGATLSATAGGAPELRAGQTVRATVVSADLDGRVTLRIGNRTLELSSSLPLAAGDKLELKVERTANQLILRLLAAPRPEQVVGNALRAALPQQAGLPPLLANLTALARGDLPMPAPRELTTLAEGLLNRLPELRGALNEQGVRQAIRDSGLFLEAKLAEAARAPGGAPATPLTNDLKGLLLRLLTGLQTLNPGGGRTPTTAAAPVATPVATAATTGTPLPLPGGGAPARPHPPLRGAPLQVQPQAAATLAALNDPLAIRGELIRQTQGALARVEVGQLSSVRTDPEANPQWIMELPLRNGAAVETVQLRMESRGAKRARQGGKSWAVTLALDLGPLGPVQARVTLGEDESVSTLFWSEREETTRAIERNLPLLHKNFFDCGLKPGRLGARTGEPPNGDEPPDIQYTLLDEKA